MHLYLKCVWFNGKEYDLTNKIWLLQEYNANADANLNSKCYSSSIWTVDILTLHTEYCTTSLGSRDDHKKVSTYVNVGNIVPRSTTFMEKNSIFIPFGWKLCTISLTGMIYHLETNTSISFGELLTENFYQFN